MVVRIRELMKEEILICPPSVIDIGGTYLQLDKMDALFLKCFADWMVPEPRKFSILRKPFVSINGTRYSFLDRNLRISPLKSRMADGILKYSYINSFTRY